MNKLVFCFFLINIVCSCDQRDSRLQGQWTAHDVYLGDEDISGIDKSGISYMTTSLIFDKDVIWLPVKSEMPIVAKFKQRDINENKIQLFGCEDSRFNRVFHYEIRLIRERNNGANKVYRLEMKSDDLYIMAERTVVNYF